MASASKAPTVDVPEAAGDVAASGASTTPSAAAAAASPRRYKGVNDDVELLAGDEYGNFADISAHIPLKDIVTKVLNSKYAGIRSWADSQFWQEQFNSGALETMLKDIFWWVYAVIMNERTSGRVLGAGSVTTAMHSKIFQRISSSFVRMVLKLLEAPAAVKEARHEQMHRVIPRMVQLMFLKQYKRTFTSMKDPLMEEVGAVVRRLMSGGNAAVFVRKNTRKRASKLAAAALKKRATDPFAATAPAAAASSSNSGTGRARSRPTGKSSASTAAAVTAKAAPSTGAVSVAADTSNMLSQVAQRLDVMNQSTNPYEKLPSALTHGEAHKQKRPTGTEKAAHSPKKSPAGAAGGGATTSPSRRSKATSNGGNDDGAQGGGGKAQQADDIPPAFPLSSTAKREAEAELQRQKMLARKRMMSALQADSSGPMDATAQSKQSGKGRTAAASIATAGAGSDSKESLPCIRPPSMRRKPESLLYSPLIMHHLAFDDPSSLSNAGRHVVRMSLTRNQPGAGELSAGIASIEAGMVWDKAKRHLVPASEHAQVPVPAAGIAAPPATPRVSRLKTADSTKKSSSNDMLGASTYSAAQTMRHSATAPGSLRQRSTSSGFFMTEGPAGDQDAGFAPDAAAPVVEDDEKRSQGIRDALEAYMTGQSESPQNVVETIRDLRRLADARRLDILDNYKSARHNTKSALVGADIVFVESNRLVERVRKQIMAHPAGVAELSNHLTAMRTFELRADEARRQDHSRMHAKTGVAVGSKAKTLRKADEQEDIFDPRKTSLFGGPPAAIAAPEVASVPASRARRNSLKNAARTRNAGVVPGSRVSTAQPTTLQMLRQLSTKAGSSKASASQSQRSGTGTEAGGNSGNLSARTSESGKSRATGRTRRKKGSKAKAEADTHHYDPFPTPQSVRSHADKALQRQLDLLKVPSFEVAERRSHNAELKEQTLEDLMFIPNLPDPPLVGADAKRQEFKSKRAGRRAAPAAAEGQQ